MIYCSVSGDRKDEEKTVCQVSLYIFFLKVYSQFIFEHYKKLHDAINSKSQILRRKRKCLLKFYSSRTGCYKIHE